VNHPLNGTLIIIVELSDLDTEDRMYNCCEYNRTALLLRPNGLYIHQILGFVKNKEFLDYCSTLQSTALPGVGGEGCE